MRKQKGFTLIELLVVIAVIALLASIILVTVNWVRAKARDGRRKADLHQIQLALGMYYDDNNQYPVVDGWVYSTTGGEWIPELGDYMAKIPVDPENNAADPWITGNYSYAYGYDTGSYPEKYDLVAQLENTGDDERCAVRCWKYHTAGGEKPWCSGCPGNPYSYSPYLYTDH